MADADIDVGDLRRRALERLLGRLRTVRLQDRMFWSVARKITADGSQYFIARPTNRNHSTTAALERAVGPLDAFDVVVDRRHLVIPFDAAPALLERLRAALG